MATCVMKPATCDKCKLPCKRVVDVIKKTKIVEIPKYSTFFRWLTGYPDEVQKKEVVFDIEYKYEEVPIARFTNREGMLCRKCYNPTDKPS